MDSAEPLRVPAARREPESRAADLPLTDGQWRDLQEAVAAAFDDRQSTDDVLTRIGFPGARRPVWADNPEAVWSQIFARLDRGIIDFPRYNLLRAVLQIYRANDVFRGLGVEYGLITPNGSLAPWAAGPRFDAAAQGGAAAAETPAGATQPSDTAQPPVAAQPSDTALPPLPREPATHGDASAQAADGDTDCHVIVRAGSEEERESAAALLRELGLEPRDVWATAHAISFRVASTEVREVRRLLDRTAIGWIVVPPGAGDYLIREFYVRGPDGRTFRVVDAPAQQTVADVAAGIGDQYPAAFAKKRPTVMDHLLPGGSVHRLSADDTLHNAGVRDGSALRMAFEATAGAPNPLDRQDALNRMRNQILQFAAARPDVEVRGLPPTLPTEYEISFAGPGLGPPPGPGAEPVPVAEHTVLIQLRADFPETAPLVFWLSPVFHPNIYPNYDGDPSRQRPEMQGLVCLGELAESYTPALDFGDLCRILIDMAAYRNYSITVRDEGLGPGAFEQERADFYDRDAAQWAIDHQPQILAMGGAALRRGDTGPRSYPNVIEPAD